MSGTINVALLTTNPSAYLVNVPEFANVQNNAAGTNEVATLSARIDQIGEMVDYDNKKISANVIASFDSGGITFENPAVFVAGTAGAAGTSGTGGTFPRTTD